MVAKILSTSNFKLSLRATYLFLGGSLLFCHSDMQWIRELPRSDASGQKISSRLSGLFVRPQISKAAMGTKSHELVIGEWIEFKENQRFIKKYMHLESRDGKKTMEIRIGTGSYDRVGPWILLSTEQRTNSKCDVSAKTTPPLHYSWDLCPKDSLTSTSSNHKLLYHFEKTDQSLANMQFESGYVEANFGIGWEVSEAFSENDLFKKIRAKFTRKEFQPHVYYNERLD